MKEFFCKYCGQVYESTDPNPAACPLCAACMDDAAAAIAEDAAGRFYVVDQSDAIIHEGDEASCRAFMRSPTTKEIAEAAGGLDLSIVSFGEWMQRNVYDGSGDRFTDPTEDVGTEPGQVPEWNGVHFTDGVQMPTREEMRAFWQHQRQLDAWAQSLTDEQRKHLCNMGFFNSSVKGYAIRAAQEFGMTEDQTRDFLQCMSYALDMLNADEAEKLYCDF